MISGGKVDTYERPSSVIDEVKNIPDERIRKTIQEVVEKLNVGK